MMRRLLFALLLLLTATACSTYRREVDANPPFAPHHYGYYDVEVNWQAEQARGLLFLAGSITNRRSAYLRYLEIKVRLLDDKGKQLARESFTDFPTYLPPGKAERFRMEFRLPPDATPARLSFTYIYWLAEEPPAFRRYDDVPYFGHFESAP